MAPTKKAAAPKKTGAAKPTRKSTTKSPSPKPRKVVKKAAVQKKSAPKSAPKSAARVVKKPVNKKVSELSKSVRNVSKGSSLFTGDEDEVPATRGKALTKRHYNFQTSATGAYVKPTNAAIRHDEPADYDPLPWTRDAAKPKDRVLTQKNNLPAACGVVGCSHVGGFADATTYQVHHDLHHQEFVCVEWRCCRGTTNNVFASASKLKSHVTEAHTPGSMKLCGKNWWCSLCYAHLKSQIEWDEHVKEMHPGVFVFQELPETHGHRD